MMQTIQKQLFKHVT